MRTNTSILSTNLDGKFELNSSQFDFYEMQQTSPDYESCNVSLHFGDSGYLTQNPETQLSSTNSEPSFEDILQTKSSDDINVQTVNSFYFCENTIFDEPKLEGYSENLYTQFINYGVPLDSNESKKLSQTSNLAYSSNYLNNSVCEPNFADEEVKHFMINDESSNTFQFCSKTTQIYDSTNVESVLDSETPIFSIFNNENHENCPESIFSRNKSNDLSDLIAETSKITNKNCESTSQSFENTTTDNFSEFDDTKQSNFNCSDSSSIVENSESENDENTSIRSDSLRFGYKNSFEVSTPEKSYGNPINPYYSPDLFSDDDLKLSLTPKSDVTHKKFILDETVLKNDKKLLRKVQDTLNGVPPPPSVTILQINVNEMLTKLKSGEQFFYRGEKSDVKKSLLINCELSDVFCKKWPDIMNCRYHGLHHNSHKVSEDFEHYCLKYGTLYVGAETASSCTIWSSNYPNSATKRRNSKLRWGVKSPGRRLSHLAKRRITFSSSNLQSNSLGNFSVIGSTIGTKQIMIDTSRRLTRKSPKKSPWKKSPSKKSRTPTGLKGLSRRLQSDSKSKISTTKRALFQSPDHSRSTLSSATENTQKYKLKRDLFNSPSKNSSGVNDRKRKRVDDDFGNSSFKFPRSLSFDVQSTGGASTAGAGNMLTRRHSEMALGSNSSREAHEDIRRKKLLWAVSEALRSQQVQFSHSNFRTCGKTLCKIIQHQMPEIFSSGVRLPGSTSEHLLKMARQHVRAVVQGKSFEEILETIKKTEKTNINVNSYIPLPSKTDENDKNCTQTTNFLLSNDRTDMKNCRNIPKIEDNAVTLAQNDSTSTEVARNSTQSARKCEKNVNSIENRCRNIEKHTEVNDKSNGSGEMRHLIDNNLVEYSRKINRHPQNDNSKNVLQDKAVNIMQNLKNTNKINELSDQKIVEQSPEMVVNNRNYDENNKARIRRQISFDEDPKNVALTSNYDNKYVQDVHR